MARMFIVLVFSVFCVGCATVERSTTIGVRVLPNGRICGGVTVILR